MCVYERFWGSSLQMDWDLTGISMSCRDGVMKSLPLTKIAFALQRRLAIGARVCTLIASRPCVAWLLFFIFLLCCRGCLRVLRERACVPGNGEGAVHQPTNEGELTQVHVRRWRSDFSDTDLR